MSIENWVANALGLISITAAIYALSQAKNQSEETKKIQANLSTRYIDKFPYFMSDLTKEISNCRSSVYILCDAPAYGAYSAPKEFIRYQSALFSIKTERDIRLIYPNLDDQKIIDEEQFESIEPPFNKDFISEFFEDSQEVTKEEVYKKLEALDKKILNQVFDLSDNKTVSSCESLLLHSWVFDHKRAIFTVRGMYDSEEKAFFTSEANLVEALLEVQNKIYVNGNSPKISI